MTLGKDEMNKRDKGCGSIRTTKRKDGRYEARLFIGYTPSGNPKQVSFYGKTKAEALKKLEEAKYKYTHHLVSFDENCTFYEFCEDFFDNSEGRTNCSAAILDKNHRLLKNHVYPFIGKTKLSDLKRGDFNRLFGILRQGHDNFKPLSVKTIRNVHSVIHAILRTAVEDEILAINPSDNCRIPKKSDSEISTEWQALTKDEEIALLERFQEDDFNLLFMFAFHSGMRQGEVLGLLWDDINFDIGSISIRRQLQKEFGEYRLKATKTRQVRTIFMTEELRWLLIKEKSWQDTMAKIDPDKWDNSMNLVFTDKTGRHLTAITVFRHFKNCARAIGKPELRFHDLRHNFASHLAMIGVPVTTSAKILGHSNTTTTQNIYQHTNTDDMRTAMIAATSRIECQKNLIGSKLGSNHISPKMRIPQTPVA